LRCEQSALSPKRLFSVRYLTITISALQSATR